MHLSAILDRDHLDINLLYFTIRLLKSSTCFEHYMLIIRRLNCTDAASGIVTLSKWPSGAPDGHLLRVTILLQVVLVQNQTIYIIIGKVHTLVQCANVEVKVLGS